MTNFQPLEVVRRGGETQLQGAENLNKLTYQGEGYYIVLWDIKGCICHFTDLSKWTI